ncbi:MAG: FtsX-like permease family protein [Hyphomicrobiales bacterium]|nr:FtsX-like permease family protein [Hyphomicrobiales bacterium]
MIIIKLAIKSLANRKATAILSIFSIALSVFLVLGVEKLRKGVRQSFLKTISSTDLVVGPRTSDVQLLLYSIFQIGEPNNNITLKSLNTLTKHPIVSWMVPISIGDSHQGFRIIGTTQSYFDHMRHPDGRKLEFQSGQIFDRILQSVIGSQVAKKLGYELGVEIAASHGLDEISFISHEREKLKVVGILEPTGTPVDHSLFVSLHTIEAMHHEWQPGQEDEDKETETHLSEVDEPELVSAAFFGLKSKISILNFQRIVNQFAREPLTAVIPGVVFSKIWRLVTRVEQALLLIAAMVALTSIIGMTITILASLAARQREMAILRSIGAGPMKIMGLFISESLVLAIAGMVIGAGCLYAGLWFGQNVITQLSGIYFPFQPPGKNEIFFVILIFVGSFFGAIIPAIGAYRISLAAGLSVKQ